MKLIIPKEIEERIHGYVMSVSSEIAGMGRVSVSPDGGSITVEEVMIYEQEVTGATADLSPQAIAKWQSDLVKAGGSPKHWKLWWHSHDNMPAFFSGRDTATIDANADCDWLCSLVVNKKREREARLDLYRPFRMYVEDMDIQIGIEEVPTSYTVPADIAEEVALKVKRPVYTKPVPSPIGYQYNKKQAPASVEGEYSKTELVAMVKTLEKQIEDFETAGYGDSVECRNLSIELVDAYYELADAETNQTISATIRAQAEQLENVIYALDYSPQAYD